MSVGEIWTCAGQEREQSNLVTMQRWGGAGESKRKEFKYSNFKNSCPCKITEMKAEIQLVEEASITCSYCQSSAHSRTVQPLYKLDCHVQTCSVPVLHPGQGSITPNRQHVRDPTSSMDTPACACCHHTAFILTQAWGVTVGSHITYRQSPPTTSTPQPSGGASAWTLHRLCAVSPPDR